MWPDSVRRVVDFLRAAQAETRIEEFPEGTPTAEDAARAAGVSPAQIVKSLLFLCDGAPVLALVPGDRRADPAKIAAAAGTGKARVAKPEEVVAATGFEPGAVAPFPHPGIDLVVIDRSLLLHEHVWVGAGSPKHMARLAPADLRRLAKAREMDAVAAHTYDSN
jgi:prolyl-tRNA editing enzyme YbaK/EbsC (Cys-tRNA(Pro) deacylase)